MKAELNELTVNGTVYVPKSEQSEPTESLDGMKYVIVRTYSAGVFAGYLKSRNGKEVVMKNARRLWYWDGAASLSQAAEEGFSKPQNCKFPQEVSEIELTEVIEILSVTKKAQKSIKDVAVWRQ
jgi:hypothetical protein